MTGPSTNGSIAELHSSTAAHASQRYICVYQVIEKNLFALMTFSNAAEYKPKLLVYLVKFF